MYISNEFNWGL
jgi:hypothetical protein